MAYYIGVDIGGTKCVVCLGQVEDGIVTILHRCSPHPTANYTVNEMLKLLTKDCRACIVLSPEKPKAIGISCGSPMDSKRGRILSPPNLIGWDDVPITDYMQEKLSLPRVINPLSRISFFCPPIFATMPTPVHWRNGGWVPAGAQRTCCF